MPVPAGHLHVVAGVIRDVRGRVLMARRTRGRDLVGLWEFPGGKVESDETPGQALVRELREELGIEASVGAPLIAVPQAAPKALVLDVRQIAGYRGTPKGLDGQALAWVPPEKLAQYPTPPADIPVIAALLQPARLLITPEPEATDGGARWLAALQQSVAEASIHRVQLRAPRFAAEHPQQWRQVVAEASAWLQQRGVDTSINADHVLARENDIGLHLRASQLGEGRSADFGDLALSASCHDAGELKAAAALGCGHALLGPVQATASHSGAPQLGWERFQALRAEVPALPVYALGGLGESDLDEARRYGAQGIAAIRGFWSG